MVLRIGAAFFFSLPILWVKEYVFCWFDFLSHNNTFLSCITHNYCKPAHKSDGWIMQISWGHVRQENIIRIFSQISSKPASVHAFWIHISVLHSHAFVQVPKLGIFSLPCLPGHPSISLSSLWWVQMASLLRSLFPTYLGNILSTPFLFYFPEPLW